MKFQHVTSAFVALSVFLSGTILGVILDKDWLTTQEQAYVEKLKAENTLLHEEVDKWLSFVKEELTPLDVFVSAEEEAFSHLTALLEQVGVEAKSLEQLDKAIGREGIVITLGEELVENNHLRQLVLENVPIQKDDVQQFYLSLLKLKLP